MLLAGVLVAGCTGEATPAEPVLTTTSSPSVSASPTASVVLPVQQVLPLMPTEASAPSTEGAAAAAGHVMRLYTYARNTADVSAWRELSDPACGFCSAVEQMVASVETNGRTLRGAGVEVHSSEATEIQPGVTYSVSLDVTESESIEYDAGEEAVARNPATRSRLYVLLEWSQGWRVLEIDVLESEPVA